MAVEAVSKSIKRRFSTLKYKCAKNRQAALLDKLFVVPASDRGKEVERHKVEWTNVQGVVPLGCKYPLFFAEKPTITEGI